MRFFGKNFSRVNKSRNTALKLRLRTLDVVFYAVGLVACFALSCTISSTRELARHKFRNTALKLRLGRLDVVAKRHEGVEWKPKWLPDPECDRAAARIYAVGLVTRFALSCTISSTRELARHKFRNTSLRRTAVCGYDRLRRVKISLR